MGGEFFQKKLFQRIFGEGNGTPLQYSCLENPMGRGTWKAAVHGVAKSRTWLSEFTFTFHSHALEEEMATHSSILAWRIPGMVEPGGLPSMGSHRVGHDWSNLAAVAAAVGLADNSFCHKIIVHPIYSIIRKRGSPYWGLSSRCTSNCPYATQSGLV